MGLRFIGEDGSMGLERGMIYSCDVRTSGGYVWVYWGRSFGHGIGCPYVSFEVMFKNWEEV